MTVRAASEASPQPPGEVWPFAAHEAQRRDERRAVVAQEQPGHEPERGGGHSAPAEVVRIARTVAAQSTEGAPLTPPAMICTATGRTLAASAVSST